MKKNKIKIIPMIIKAFLAALIWRLSTSGMFYITINSFESRVMLIIFPCMIITLIIYHFALKSENRLQTLFSWLLSGVFLILLIHLLPSLTLSSLLHEYPKRPYIPRPDDYVDTLSPGTGVIELFYLLVYSLLTLCTAVYSIGCSTPRHTKTHRL